MNVLSVVELINSVDPVKKRNIYNNKYVVLRGFFNEGYLFESEKDDINKTGNFIPLNHNAKHGVMPKLFKDTNTGDKGNVELVCKIIQPIRIEISHVAAAKLLDESGKEASLVQLEGGDLPIELRNKKLFT